MVGPTFCCFWSVEDCGKLFLSIVAVSISTLFRREKCDRVPVFNNCGDSGGIGPLGDCSFRGETGDFDAAAA